MFHLLNIYGFGDFKSQIAFSKKKFKIASNYFLSYLFAYSSKPNFNWMKSLSLSGFEDFFFSSLMPSSQLASCIRVRYLMSKPKVNIKKPKKKHK
jgi:hypothetical protein